MNQPNTPEGGVAVVVLNMGGPDRLESVEPFLANLLADPALIRLPFFMRPFQGGFARFIARRRSVEVRENYAKIGGGSPLRCWSELQAILVCRGLASRGIVATPHVAMRYWHPFADEAVAELRASKPRAVVVLSLYPQFSGATSGSSLDDMKAALVRGGMGDIPCVVIDRFPALPGYLDATAATIRDALDTMGGPTPHVTFSAHGLPVSYIKSGDPYRDEIEATFRGILERLPEGLDTSLCFQSRVGPAEWLRPYTEDHVADLARRGVKRLLMVPLAFVSDHIETLYEMDMLYGAEAVRLGMEFRRVPALNGSPLLADALTQLVSERLEHAGVGVPS